MDNNSRLQKILSHQLHLMEVKDKVKEPYKVFVQNRISQTNNYLTKFARSQKE